MIYQKVMMNIKIILKKMRIILEIFFFYKSNAMKKSFNILIFFSMKINLDQKIKNKLFLVKVKIKFKFKTLFNKNHSKKIIISLIKIINKIKKNNLKQTINLVLLIVYKT